ncbi:hypothetical protein APHAL10511_007610 [Amanita phalloides]|nr:hypothetical protein APHAL10511_007610 [Amanita phalloides]
MPRYHTPLVRTRIDMTTFTRWRLASQCLKDYAHIWNRYKCSVQPTQIHQDVDWTLSEYPNTLCKDTFVDVEVPNWPGKELIRTGNEFYPVLFFSLCVSIYGGLHAAAWNDYFPTNTERFLWRFSSLYVAGSGVLYVGMKMSDVLLFWIRSTFRLGQNPGFDKGFFVGLLDLIWMFTGIIIGFVQIYAVIFAYAIYIFARVFLFIEAFISLRRLPVEVYLTPSWTQYLSHF